jgi:hypothetical protein
MMLRLSPQMAAQVRFAAMLSEQTPEEFCLEAIQDSMEDVAAVMEGAWPRPAPDLPPLGIFRPESDN